MKDRLLAGIFKRFLSYTLDFWLLKLVSFVLSFVFFWGMSLLGMPVERTLIKEVLLVVVSCLYFVILQSSIGEGQTFGQCACGIKVLRVDGSYLSPFRTFLRYLVLLPFVCDVPFSLISPCDAMFRAEILLMLFWVAGVFVLTLFHPLKRGLQDIVAGSVVVRDEKFNVEGLKALMVPGKEKRAFLVLALCCLVLATGEHFVGRRVYPTLIAINSVGQEIERNTKFHDVKVNYWRSSSLTDKTVTRRIEVKGFLDDASSGDEISAEAEKVAEIVCGLDFNELKYAFVNVQPTVQTDAGNKTFNFVFTSDGKPYSGDEKSTNKDAAK